MNTFILELIGLLSLSVSTTQYRTIDPLIQKSPTLRDGCVEALRDVIKESKSDISQLEDTWFTPYYKICNVSAVNAKNVQVGRGDLSLPYCVQPRKYKFLIKCDFSDNQYVKWLYDRFGKSEIVKTLFQYNLNDAVPANVSGVICYAIQALISERFSNGFIP